MTKEKSKNNEVFLFGNINSEPTISHDCYGGIFYNFTLKVSRLSEEYDYLPITAPTHLFKEKGLPSVGDKLAIEGQFRSYNKIEGEHSKLMLTVFVIDFSYTTSSHLHTNTIELFGYICKKPVYRTTPFHREICDIFVAVNRAFRKSDYIPCIAWGKNAHFCNTFNIGTKINLLGRIQSREYNKKVSEENIETRTAYEVSVNKIILD